MLLPRTWNYFLSILLVICFSASNAFSHEPAVFDAKTRTWVAPEILEIKERGYLVVGMHGIDQPPFIVTVGNTTEGTDIELAKSLAELMGVDIRINRQAKSFNGVIDLLVKGEVDLAISKLSRTATRSQITIASKPYLKFRQGFLANRVELTKLQGERSIQATIKDFSGTIGLVKGTAWKERALKHFPKASITEYGNWAEVINALVLGEVTVAYRDEFEVEKIIAKDQALAITLKTIVFEDLLDTLGIFTAIENPSLARFVDIYLELYHEELTTKDLLELFKTFDISIDG